MTGTTQKNFEDIITFTRASGGGRFNSSGVYEWLGNNVPRLDYDPVTLQPRGILTEEQRTNLLTYSEQYANWTNGGVAVTSDYEASPAGTMTADRVVAVGGSFQSIYKDVTTTATPHTFSVYMKSSSGANQTLRIWLDTTPSVASVITVTSEWQRFSLTGTPDTNTRVQIGVTATADPFDVLVWGAQLEAGAFPTSYIPTVAAQVTRAADNAVVNTLSPWYNAAEGTLFVEFSRQWVTSSLQGRVAYIAGPTADNVIQVRAGGSGAALGTITSAGVITADIASAVLPVDAAKAALSWSSSGASFSAGGIDYGLDTSVAVPVGLVSMHIGSSFGGAHLRGHIRRIQYYPRRLTNSELQAITA